VDCGIGGRMEIRKNACPEVRGIPDSADRCKLNGEVCLEESGYECPVKKELMEERKETVRKTE